MGLRDRLNAAADRAATALSFLFVTAPDHPGSGGVTGADSPAGDRTHERSDDRNERDRKNEP
jgi:hypothetical protein